MITEYDATNQRGVYKRTTTSQLLSLGISTKSKYRKMSLSTSKVEQAHILEHAISISSEPPKQAEFTTQQPTKCKPDLISFSWHAWNSVPRNHHHDHAGNHLAQQGFPRTVLSWKYLAVRWCLEICMA